MAERPRILVVECMQEISSFNPLPSGYENFHIERGDEMLAQDGLNTGLGGAMPVLRAAGFDLVLTMAARAGSGGLLSAAGWARLSAEMVQAIEAGAKGGVDGVYFSLHGAMGADGELDPEGWLLRETRRIVGEAVPIVISLDLHGILTDRMLKQVNGLAIYHTYPHVDFADTGQRAARLLVRIVKEKLKTSIARVVIPALARGDECVTKSGCYGDLIREAQRIERDGTVLAAGIMIGNPFTDVPELCSQVLVCTAGDEATAKAEATRIAEEFWPLRFRMQSKFISLERAIAQAETIKGPVVFTDAADATSSGATGDSAIIIDGLRRADTKKRVLAQVVDPRAAAAAHEAGVGATIDVTLGGAIDPKRFKPMRVSARVKLLSDGRARLETMKTGLDAGPTAVLTFGTFTVVVFSKTLSLFDRAMYYANGLDPRDFDVIVVKSPHTEFHMYDQWVEKNFNIDIPGATSNNLPTLGHTICMRPMYPLDPGVEFHPRPVVYARQG
ncbi:M81 family metallopeptidase [Alsobacter sp. SYSU M60028]|uniref:Microcystinase C n=1 Tax=Alsobacter ponti TaxID=2962936 RepID=A0ABT1LEE1_9HYPH|nr:M81 family metallopeptidase [Alsobacter ponti]MCP8939110.1 M81 family metallopeptidase [Alsobacter ponti]